MARKTRPLQEEDLPAVAAFLKKTFGSVAADVADAASLRWKYLRAGPSWDGSRAFVVEQDGAIVGHAGLIPATFLSPDRPPITSLVVVDWAADPLVPGVGVALYANLIRKAETAFLVGGVEVTREIVPKLGFRQFTEAKVYSRWIRPWREFWQREKSTRAVQRLAHAVVHGLRFAPLRPDGWLAREASRFDEAIDHVVSFRPAHRTTFARTLASLNHMLDCPRSPMRAHLLESGGRVRGYAIVALIDWEARVVDLNIDSERDEDWSAAYAALATALRRLPSVCRIRVMSAVPQQQRALETNGFWVNQHEPFMLYDPKSRAPELPLDLQFFESDLGYA